jgi:hypothetical protein
MKGENKMDHVVYLDAEAKELDNLLSGKKTMIIRGAAGRKVPYRQVKKGDILYFINNNAEGMIKAKAQVSCVINSDKTDKDTSIKLVKNNQNKLQLTEKQFKRWAGKRYIILIEIKNIEEITPFQFNRDDFKNRMDDWLPVEKIEIVKK